MAPTSSRGFRPAPTRSSSWPRRATSSAPRADGAYQFFGLAAGSYQVEFVALAGYQFSPQHQGSNNALDSDADPLTGRTGLFTLTGGEQNLDIDAGLYSPLVPLGPQSGAE